MKKFAQMSGNRVNWIFEAEKKPEFALNINLIDITNETGIKEKYMKMGTKFYPPYPSDIIKPQWNATKKKWEESATQKEIDDVEKEKLIKSEIQLLKTDSALRDAAIQSLKDANKLDVNGDLIK